MWGSLVFPFPIFYKEPVGAMSRERGAGICMTGARRISPCSVFLAPVWRWCLDTEVLGRLRRASLLSTERAAVCWPVL